MEPVLKTFPVEITLLDIQQVAGEKKDLWSILPETKFHGERRKEAASMLAFQV